jgi:hypothetical protein
MRARKEIPWNQKEKRFKKTLKRQASYSSPSPATFWEQTPAFVYRILKKLIPECLYTESPYLLVGENQGGRKKPKAHFNQEA